MAVNAFAVIGAGAIGTTVSQLLPNSVLIGRKEEAPFFNGESVLNYSTLKEACRSSYTVFFCVKSYDLYNAVSQTLPFLHPVQNIILLSNGFVHEIVFRRLLRDFPNVWAGFTTTAAFRNKTDVILHHNGTLSLAPLSDSPQQLPRLLNLNVLIASYKLISWQKAVINTMINPLGLIFEAENRKLLSVAELKNILHQVYEEMYRLADIIPVGIHDLTEIEDIIEQTGKNRCSSLQDFLAGNRSELPHITGVLIKRARRMGINLELTEALYHLAMEKSRIIQIS